MEIEKTKWSFEKYSFYNKTNFKAEVLRRQLQS